MVVLDSDHSYQHVIQELRQYNSLVSLDSYLVVEDTNLDGVPILEDYDGPMRAVREFLDSDDGKDFVQDYTREAMVLTFNPGGWLRRTAASTDGKEGHSGKSIQASVKRQSTGFRTAEEAADATDGARLLSGTDSHDAAGRPSRVPSSVPARSS